MDTWWRERKAVLGAKKDFLKDGSSPKNPRTEKETETENENEKVWFQISVSGQCASRASLAGILGNERDGLKLGDLSARAVVGGIKIVSRKSLLLFC